MAYAVPLLEAANASAATVLAVTGVTAGPSLGKVGAASVSNGGAVTTFTVNASTGAITIGGSGGRVLSTATKITVTVKCTGGKCSSGGNGKITATGTPTGRAGALANFTVAGSGVTVTSQTAGTTLFTLPNSVNQNATETFTIGMDIPIAGDSSSAPSGAATSSYMVEVAAGAALPSSPVTGTASATVYRGLTLTKTSDMQFGTIVGTSAGSGTVALNASTGAVTVTGTGAAAVTTSTHGAATFSINGEGGETVAFTVPTKFTMSLGTAQLVVTTSTSKTSPVTLSGSPGSAGSTPLGVGGSLTISNATVHGTYQGVFTVTVAYN